MANEISISKSLPLKIESSAFSDKSPTLRSKTLSPLNSKSPSLNRKSPLVSKSPAAKSCSNPSLTILKKYRKVRSKETKYRPILPRFTFDQIKPKKKSGRGIKPQSSGYAVLAQSILLSDLNSGSNTIWAKERQEQDLEALMKASTTIINLPQMEPSTKPLCNIKKVKESDVKKKTKAQRDIETCLNILFVSNDDKEARNTLFCRYYMEKVQKTVDNGTWLRFLQILSNFNTKKENVVQLFEEIQEVFREHSDLSEEFVGTLSPEEAQSIGRYMEYSDLSGTKEFLHAVKITFAQNPSYLMKFVKTLKQLKNKPICTFESLRGTILPLLKGNQFLIDRFNKLLATERPPESAMTQFEEVNMVDVDIENIPPTEQMEEIPEGSVVDTEQFGTDNCPCACHSQNDSKFSNRLRHCDHCGVKFIDGKVYIQTGKVLRPAKVIYKSSPVSDDRLSHTPPSNPELLSKCEPLSVMAKGSPSSCSNTKYEQQSLSAIKLESTLTKGSSSADISHISPDLNDSISIVLPPSSKAETCVSPIKTTCESTARVDKSGPEDAVSELEMTSLVKSREKLENSGSTEYRDSTDANPKPSPNQKANAIDVAHSGESKVVEESGMENDCEMADEEEDSDNESDDWTESEDRIILVMCKEYGGSAEAIDRIAKELPNRTERQISDRFLHLLSLIMNKS